MKLRKEEISKLAGLILKNLKDHGLIVSKSSDGELLSKIDGIILKNLEDEAAIEEAVRKLMDQYRAQIASGAIDPQKMYMMMKKQVAKERKFIL